MLNPRLLESQPALDPLDGRYSSCFNARGLYDSMQFVLRLRPDIHRILDEVPIGIHSSERFDLETLQAFSTFLHESVHWWQHSGSIAGLVISLSYPAQSHINHDLLKEYVRRVGAYKSVVQSITTILGQEESNSERLRAANEIVNNYSDIEYFKYLSILPSSAESFVNEPLFESKGHSFSLAYASFINLMSATVDPNLNYLPDAREWGSEFRRLREKRQVNHYYGSPVHLAPIGLKEIFEGQARFAQIQYLHFGSGGALEWEDFDKAAMLSGVYIKAFQLFLELSEAEWPSSVDDPLVALFMLVCDLAINPTEGFPFDIVHFESFVDSVDPGTRFLMLCRVLAVKHPELKAAITAYTAEEYKEVVDRLSDAIVCPSPHAAAQRVCEWVDRQPAMAALMEEERSFNFLEQNLPVRVLLSRYVRFQQDKLRYPEVFCWPGAHMAGTRCSERSMQIFLEHQSLFADKADGDIYPRAFPDKEEAAVQRTFDAFYVWVSVYDLSRQWIAAPGLFEYDYFWLSSKYSKDVLEAWAKHNFSTAYGVSPDDFTVLE
jgi:hypothetical protein